MSGIIRIGCIGCGGKAHHHLSIIKQETPEIEPVAYADVRKEAADSFLSQFGGKYATDDGQKILEDPDIDTVMICTRHDSHALYAINAAKNHKRIFIEKPLALTIEECLEIERAVARYGVYLQVGFQNRFESRIQRVKQIIKYPIVLLGRYTGGCWGEQSWAWDKITGGGYILSAGCHLYDLMHFLSGSEPIEIYAGGSNYYHPGDDRPDAVVSIIKFASSAVATLLCGDCNGKEMNYLLELYNGTAGASVSDNFNKITSWGVAIEDDCPPGGVVPHTGVVGQWKTFVERILNNGESPVTARAGTIATAMVLKSFESIRTGQPTPMNL